MGKTCLMIAFIYRKYPFQYIPVNIDHEWADRELDNGDTVTISCIDTRGRLDVGISHDIHIMHMHLETIW